MTIHTANTIQTARHRNLMAEAIDAIGPIASLCTRGVMAFTSYLNPIRFASQMAMPLEHQKQLMG